MKSVQISLATSAVLAALCAPALAQDAEFKLPDQCLEQAEMDHAAMGHGNEADGTDVGDLPEHVRENMAKMRITMPAMEQGMMNQDADVAFACGMIAHHQGAIDMAQVLLEHGDDPQMRALAEEIMAAQIGEIQQMTSWLVEQTR